MTEQYMRLPGPDGNGIYGGVFSKDGNREALFDATLRWFQTHA
jgi:hypothetical protein